MFSFTLAWLWILLSWYIRATKWPCLMCSAGEHQSLAVSDKTASRWQGKLSSLSTLTFFSYYWICGFQILKGKQMHLMRQYIQGLWLLFTFNEYIKLYIFIGYNVIFQCMYELYNVQIMLNISTFSKVHISLCWKHLKSFF
jgi:hypothetical protein